MPTKRIPTIRVIWYDKGSQDQSGLLIEQLRHLGLVRILKDFTPLPVDESDRLKVLRQYEGYVVLEIQCLHRGTDAYEWCRQNADRMTSFGINAIVAPRWESYDSDLQSAINVQMDFSSIDKMQ